jgi:hypothetical protein
MTVYASGYNVVLKNIEIPKGFEKVSIIQFLRNLRYGKSLPEKVAITGIDVLLCSIENPRWIVKYIMARLREKNRDFRRKNKVLLFIPNNDLYEDGEIYCKVGRKKAKISAIFASRLHITASYVYHADFEF